MLQATISALRQVQSWTFMSTFCLSNSSFDADGYQKFSMFYT